MNEEKEKNYLKFEFVDNHNKTIYNSSIKMEKSWYGADDYDEVLSIDTFYDCCKEFALAMGFHPKTIEDVFGGNDNEIK